MPECAEFSVRADLLVANFDETLSEDINLRMGKAQQADHKRIQDALAAGQRLPERQLPDLPEVLHLGKQCDMSLLVVEAGSSAFHGDASSVQTGEDTLGMVGTLVSKPSRADQNNQHYHADEVVSTCDRTTQTLKNTTNAELQHTTPQALSLSIKTSPKTFCENGRGICNAKDLCIEVYLNGDLVDVVYLPCRELGRSLLESNDTIRFSGTRVHRQVEKPWAYNSRPKEDYTGAAGHRWTAINMRLQEHADLKGTTDNGPSLSRYFLDDLAKTKLPSSLAHRTTRFSTLDVVIVAGKGLKYGPSTPYLKCPRFLACPRLSIDDEQVVNHPKMAQQASSQHEDAPPNRVIEVPSPSVKLTARLAQQFSLVDNQYKEDLYYEGIKADSVNEVRTTTAPQSLDPLDIAGALRPIWDPIPDGLLTATGVWTSFDTNHDDGLMEPSVDVDQASATLEHNVFEHLSAYIATSNDPYQISEQPSVTYLHGYPSPPRAPYDQCIYHDDLVSPIALYGPGMPVSKHVPLATAPSDVDLATISPVSTFHTPPLIQAPMTPGPSVGVASTTPVAPSQSDPHISAPDPNGSPRKHRRRHSSQDEVVPTMKQEQRTPKKAKLQFEMSPKLSTRQSKTNLITSPTKYIPQTPRRKPFDPSSPSRPGSRRSAQRWDPHERTVQEELDNFSIPLLTQHSAITYAGPGTQRQIGKIRGGEFKEQVFICGMRFIVD